MTATLHDRPPLIIDQATRLKWTLDSAAWVADVIQPAKISEQQREVLKGYDSLVQARLHRRDVLNKSTTVPLTQEEIALCQKFGISIQSGKGTGKNAVVAWMILHFMDNMPQPNIKLMFTAPTEEQLRNNLWAEIYKWIQKSPYLTDIFSHTAEKVYMKRWDGKAVFATWKTSSKSADPDDQGATLAGKHEDYMILGADEASGLGDPVFRPLESTMTGICNFAIITFNPTKPTGYAIQTQTTDKENWLAYHWDAEQSDVVDPMHVERYAKKYGRDSNMYRINVRGLPPRSDADVFLPYHWVDLAVNAPLEPDDEDCWVAGLDVAGAGADQTVLTIGCGGRVEHILDTNLVRKKDIAFWVEDYWLKYDLQAVAVDVNGLGAGVAEELEDLGVYVLWVNAGCEAERRSDLCERLRDELWWEVREAFQNFLVSIPDHEELMGELTSIKYEDHRGSKGKMKIESKREMKRRGLKSPDHADAFCLWWYATQRRGKRPRPSLHRTNRRRRRPTSWMAV